MPPRMLLRAETPYPYFFTDATALYPDNPKEAFGRIIRKDREEGLKEIHAAIAEADAEHSWVFIPSESVWIDTTQDTTDKDVIQDNYLPTFLSHLFPDVELVHTHPDKVIQRVSEKYSHGYTADYLREAAIPSTDDFIRHWQLFRRSNPTTRVVNSVVSHYGVTSFELNESGRTTSGFSTDGYENRIPTISSDPAENIGQALENMRNHVLLRDGQPIFDFKFKEL